MDTELHALISRADKLVQSTPMPSDATTLYVAAILLLLWEGR